ncbi:metal ABC transporter solute-binding protein, Zn/Mn family [Lactococcus insecticola]|uniref:metal ABC transporter solute-binding protein, Zn/Mn family n=1 Tax=Pseudolactococcus insecticola TaxID=2709158 RepID=UPI0015574111
MTAVFAALLVLVGVSVLAACTGGSKSARKSDKLQIVTTFYPMQAFTKAVVGDAADVVVLVKPGVEPHDFEPSAKDVATIQGADAFVYNSPALETWVAKTTGDLKNVPVIEAAKGIKLLTGTSDEGEGDKVKDPHVWLSPELAAKEVATIRDALVAKFPDKKAVFTANAAAYLAKLKSLDADYRAAFSDAKEKNFVTQHAAFAYLAQSYGLHQVSVSGIDPEVEPSATRLKTLKAYVAKNKIKYIYFEENASDKVAKTLADEAHVKTLALNPLESLTKAQEDAGEDYISVMKTNLVNLEKTTNNG